MERKVENMWRVEHQRVGLEIKSMADVLKEEGKF